MDRKTCVESVRERHAGSPHGVIQQSMLKVKWTMPNALSSDETKRPNSSIRGCLLDERFSLVSLGAAETERQSCHGAERGLTVAIWEVGIREDDCTLNPRILYPFTTATIVLKQGRGENCSLFYMHEDKILHCTVLVEEDLRSLGEKRKKAKGEIVFDHVTVIEDLTWNKRR